MWRACILAVLAFIPTALPERATDVVNIKGQYVEVRTCDVWTGPCFANGEGNLTGKNAALVWHVTEGTFDNVKLDGLSVVAVVEATDTLGARQHGASKAIIIVDSKANELQRQALVKLAQRQGGDLVANIASVQQSGVTVNICNCHGDGCAEIDAGVVKIKTRCINEHHDGHCGNETCYYPPLTQGVQCVPAVAEHGFSGNGLASTWTESDRRGAYVGTFTVR